MRFRDALVYSVAVVSAIAMDLIAMLALSTAIKAEVGSAVIETGAILVAMLALTFLLNELLQDFTNEHWREYREFQDISEIACRGYSNIFVTEADRYRSVGQDGLFTISRPLPNLDKYVDL